MVLSFFNLGFIVFLRDVTEISQLICKNNLYTVYFSFFNITLKIEEKNFFFSIF